MNELDFINALSDKEKTAGAKEYANSLMAVLKSRSPEIAAGAVGAAGATGLQYLMNRSVRGQPSTEQRAATALLTSVEAAKDQAERDNRPLTFKDDFLAAGAKSAKNWADVFQKHPGKGALLVAPAGAYIGLRVLKALK